jgi:predicted nuclease of predicted toxin-antitoxin system
MTILIDAHLSPAIATWITTTFGIPAVDLRDLGFVTPPIMKSSWRRGVNEQLL